MRREAGMRGHERMGFTAGVIAAIALLAGVALARLLSGAPSLLEVVADGILLLVPGALFSSILDALQHAAKPLLYLGIAVGVIVVGGVLGRWYARDPTWPRAFSIAGVAWLAFGGGVYTLTGAGAFGSNLEQGALWHGGSLALLFGLFAVVLHQAYGWLAARSAGETALAGHLGEQRRALVLSSLSSLVVIAIAGGIWRLVRSAGAAAPTGPAVGPAVAGLPAGTAAGVPAQNPAPWNVPGLSLEITPADRFYTVSKNLIDPTVDARGWKLRISGLVKNPLELTYDQLRALPATTGSYTLMCISNEVGGDLWGNAIWRGVLLKTLLDRAVVQPGVKKVAFSAADGYLDSVPLDRALNPQALVAWEMNGKPLPNEHGFPARLLIPGIYGMKNVKWVTEIRFMGDDIKGYWQERGWDDAAPYQTASRFDVPRNRATLSGGTIAAAGVAFAGDRGIAKVEVSTDGGATWHAAELKPPLSPNSWQLWRVELPLPSGSHTLEVRATDGQGHRQIQQVQPPYPSGSTGYHTITVAM